MNLAEKKNDVVKTLLDTNDEAVIDEVYKILHPAYAVEDVEVSQLSEPLQDKLNKALEDFKSGNYITHDEMKAKAEKWLIK